MLIKQEKVCITTLKRNNMKYLKIESGKGFYWDGKEYCEIDKINKDNIFNLLDLAGGDDFELDAYKEEDITNEAQKIIYENIYNKFNQFLDNKEQFAVESEELYRAAIGKYSVEMKTAEADKDFGGVEPGSEESIRVQDFPF